MSDIQHVLIDGKVEHVVVSPHQTPTKESALAPMGCGFWIASRYENKVQPSEWWECVIPDTEHDGRDHLLVRQP